MGTSDNPVVHRTGHYSASGACTSAVRWGLERLTVEVLCLVAALDSPVHSVFSALTFDAHCSLFAVDLCSVGSPDMSGTHRTVR
jgi:hypothetical protein